MISKTIREGERILALKPTRVKHDFDSNVKSNLISGTITFTSKRYKTRMMRTATNQVCGRPSYRRNLTPIILPHVSSSELMPCNPMGQSQ